jgi:uncharacterized delta-60 repeat protein
MADSCSPSTSTLRRLSADGSFDSTFHPAVFGGSSAVLQPDGEILVFGNLAVPGWATPAPLIRITPTGEIDPEFHPVALSEFGYLRALAVQSDGKILIGGYFGAVDGLPRKSVARLNSDGTLDLSFAPNGGARDSWGEGGYVTQLGVQGDKVVLDGSFSEVNGVPWTGLVRLNLVAIEPPGELAIPNLFNIHRHLDGAAFSTRTVVGWDYDVESVDVLPASIWTKRSSFQGDGYVVTSQMSTNEVPNAFFRISVRKP